MRKSDLAAILLCIASMILGACLVYYGISRDNLWTSPWTFSAGVYIGIGAAGIGLVRQLSIIGEKLSTSLLVGACASLAIVVISLITYAASLGFGAAA